MRTDAGRAGQIGDGLRHVGVSLADRFNHAFQFWKQRIVDHPEPFKQGWDIERVRLTIRDFADEYGTDILQAAHLIGGPAHP